MKKVALDSEIGLKISIVIFGQNIRSKKSINTITYCSNNLEAISVAAKHGPNKFALILFLVLVAGPDSTQYWPFVQDRAFEYWPFLVLNCVNAFALNVMSALPRLHAFRRYLFLGFIVPTSRSMGAFQRAY